MGFTADYLAQTEPHPLIRGQRVWNSVVTVEVHVYRAQVRLMAIYSLYPNRGHASRCLDWIIKLTQAYSLPLTGHAKQFVKGRLPTMELRRWYKRHGAKIDRQGEFTIQ